MVYGDRNQPVACRDFKSPALVASMELMGYRLFPVLPPYTDPFLMMTNHPTAIMQEMLNSSEETMVPLVEDIR